MEQIKTKTVISDTIDNWLVSTKGRDVSNTETLQPYLAKAIFKLIQTRADDLSMSSSSGTQSGEDQGDHGTKRIMNQVAILIEATCSDRRRRVELISKVSRVNNDAIPTRSFLHFRRLMRRSGLVAGYSSSGARKQGYHGRQDHKAVHFQN